MPFNKGIFFIVEVAEANPRPEEKSTEIYVRRLSHSFHVARARQTKPCEHYALIFRYRIRVLRYLS